ncbi:Abi-domain-containing protein, partial [Piedraia hortae CBS 480.64]
YPTMTITPKIAWSTAICHTILYVTPFYLSPTLRSTPLRSRDHPKVIKARIQSVCLVCVAACLWTTALLAYLGLDFPAIIRLLAIWPVSVLDIARVLALVAILFIGPLFELFLDGVQIPYIDWIAWRNYVAAPISEELIFRSLVIPLCLLAGMSPAKIVFTTPPIFGLAHFHHFASFLRSHTPEDHNLPPIRVWVIGFLASLFQFSYTTVFGMFATFVILRTGNLPAAIVTHSFCNYMGVPRLSGRVGTPSRGLIPTITYYLLLIVGIVVFYQGLLPLTESRFAI